LINTITLYCHKSFHSVYHRWSSP